MAFSKVKQKLQRSKHTYGFTLVELMIVVAIIGILAGVAIPRYMNFIKRSKEGATKGNLGTLRSALNIYYADTELYFPEIISIDPGWPNWLYTADGYGWQIHNDFKNYLDNVPDCTIGPSPGGPIPTRNTIWHQGIQWPWVPPNPADDDVGWWYYRSTDPVTGLTTVARIFVNVKGIDNKNVYYTMW